MTTFRPKYDIFERKKAFFLEKSNAHFLPCLVGPEHFVPFSLFQISENYLAHKSSFDTLSLLHLANWIYENSKLDFCAPLLYRSPLLCICPQPHLYVFAPPINISYHTPYSFSTPTYPIDQFFFESQLNHSKFELSLMELSVRRFSPEIATASRRPTFCHKILFQP